MKRKHKRELRMLRAEHLELKVRHEALTRSVTQIMDDYKHLTEALHQRGIWNVGNYSKLKAVP